MTLQSHNIFVLLVITVIFGTVELVNVQEAFATDSVVIQNSVKSATYTGGQSSSGGQSGQNGTDGTDGKSSQDGKDGAHGADGQDGSVFNGESTTYTHVESFVNGESVEQQTTMSDDSVAHATVTTEFHASPEVKEEVEYVDATTQTFIQALESLRLILSKYVSLLF